MTIFGFNTNVPLGDVAYHVQSEARQHDLVLQTLVFVKGQCVGKHTYSYAARTLQSGFSDEAIHELLKAQHKAVIDALHEGNMELVLGGGEVYDIDSHGLSLKWTNPAAASHGVPIGMSFHVQDSGKAAAGAEIVVFPCPPGGAAVMARALTDASGNATLMLSTTSEVEHQGGVMVRATHGSKSTTRKFRFKR